MCVKINANAECKESARLVTYRLILLSSEVSLGLTEQHVLTKFYHTDTRSIASYLRDLCVCVCVCVCVLTSRCWDRS